jgi:hypothetical protein
MTTVTGVQLGVRLEMRMETRMGMESEDDYVRMHR